MFSTSISSVKIENWPYSNRLVIRFW